MSNPRRDNIVTSLGFRHQKVHEGLLYQAHLATADGAPLADDASMDVLLFVPPSIKFGAHVIHQMWCEGLSQSYIYEAPTVTVEGTPILPINHKRNSANVAQLQVFSAPTIAAVGTPLLPGSWADWALPIEYEEEHILAPDTYYLYRVTARAATLRASTDLVWYEG